MRTYSAFNQTAVDNPHASPIRLIKIEFDGLTLYLCDRIFGSAGSENTFNSQIYEPLILHYGEVRYGQVGVDGKPGDPGEFDFTLDNTISIGGADSFTSLFTDYDPIYSKVTLYETYEGASAAGDLVTRFVGTVEDIDMERERVTINCTSYEISVMNKVSIEVCDQDSYPGADPDDWGKILPIIYGNAKRVPMRAVDAGEMTTLSEDINSTVTVINVTDASGFPAGGGTIQIDIEEITYSYTSGNQFVGCTRGANGTDADAHDAGATVAEIQSEYFYVLDHPIKSIDNVYVVHRDNGQNILQDSSLYTIYTGQTGDEHASYPGKAVVVFNTIPSISPQVNLSITDTIDVDDTISVSDTIGVGTGSHGHGGDGYYVWNMENAVDISGPAGYIDEAAYDKNSSRYNLSDGTISSYVNMMGGEAAIQLSKAFVEEGPGTPSYYRLNMVITYQSTAIRATFTWNGKSITSAFGAAGQGTLRSGWISTGLTWSQINALVGTVKLGTYIEPIYGTATIREAWIEIEHSAVVAGPATGVTKLGAAAKAGAATKTGTVSLTGNSVADTVIGGRVSIDVQGWQADASGNYGTVGSLIERPDYVFKHFLVNYCGLTIADNIDGTSYNASGVLYTADAVALSIVLQELPDIREFLASMAFQCKSLEFWEAGKHHLVRVPVSSTSVRTLDKERIDLNSIKVSYSPRSEVLNTYVGNYYKHWIGDFESDIESFREIVKATSSQSVAIFGTLESEPIEFPFINNATQATRVLNWMLDDNDFPYLIVQFSGGHYLSDLQRGDVIDFRFVSGDELDRRFLGLIDSEADQFRIMDMVEDERGNYLITANFEVSSSSASGTFYPSVAEDDGYTQGSNFYNTTVANVFGNYTGDPYTSTTTTTSSSTSSTASTTSTTSTTTTTV